MDSARCNGQTTGGSDVIPRAILAIYGLAPNWLANLNLIALKPEFHMWLHNVFRYNQQLESAVVAGRVPVSGVAQIAVNLLQTAARQYVAQGGSLP